MSTANLYVPKAQHEAATTRLCRVKPLLLWLRLILPLFVLKGSADDEG